MLKIFISLVLIFTSAYSQDLNIVCDNSDNLILESVKQDENTTSVFLKYIVGDNYKSEISLYSKEDESHFILTDINHSKRYKLLDIRGISLYPKKHKFKKKGESLRFELVFEKVNIEVFDLFEAYEPKIDNQPWIFTNINVNKPNKNFDEKSILNKKPIEIAKPNYKNFNGLITKSSNPVLIRFWASWCGPCREMKPHFKKAVRLRGDNIKFAEIDIDKYEKIADFYDITSVPTVILFVDGKRVARESGSLDAYEILEFVRLNLK